MHKQQGFILSFVLLLLIFIAIVLYGLAQLALVSQSDVGGKKDLLLARQYAQVTIFDGVNGAVGKILAFESVDFRASIGVNSGTTLETLSLTDRIKVKNAYFTNSCLNAVGGSMFSKGLCTNVENLDATNYYSHAWLRASSAVTKPCTTYSKTSVASNADDLPLLDDANSRYSFLDTVSNMHLCTQPRFIIEMLNPSFSIPSVVDNARLYRVTSRAFGVNGNSIATTQAYFYVRCLSSTCYISLFSNNILY